MPTMHAALCKHLGRCTAGNTSGMHVLFDKPGWESWPGVVDDAIACLSESRHVSGGRYSPALPCSALCCIGCWQFSTCHGTTLSNHSAFLCSSLQMNVRSAEVAKRLIRVGRLLVGVGTECRGAGFCDGR